MNLLLYHNKKFEKKISSRSYLATGMGRRCMCAWRRGARVFHRVPVLVSTPGLSLLYKFGRRGKYISCQDVDGAGR